MEVPVTARNALATSLASGLAGWLQLQAAQRLAHLSGEDSARLIVCQIIGAQARYIPIVSALPQNWGTTKKRIDIALKGHSKGTTGWYGAIEVKWPGEATDWHASRLAIFQDVLRLGFIKTGNLNAKFLVLGGSKQALQDLFDTAHPKSQEREERRTAFSNLLSRDPANPAGELAHAIWSARFPGAADRVPPGVFNGYTGKVKAELVATSAAEVGATSVGSVYVWQCSRSKPKRAAATGPQAGAGPGALAAPAGTGTGAAGTPGPAAP